MNRIYFNLLVLLISSFCFSQKTNDSLKVIEKELEQHHELLKKHHKKIDTIAYMPIEHYRKSKQYVEGEELDFKMINGDTLVKIKGYVRPKGVRVAYEYKDSTFLYFYKKIAFNHKKDSFSDKTKMKYWKDEIKLYFSKNISKKTKKDFLKFTSYIDKNVDSLHIKEVKKIEESNFIIYYYGDYEYESKLSKLKSSNNYVYWNGNSQIYKGYIKLDTNLLFNEKLIAQKLNELFILSLGHFNATNELECESYFSNCYSNRNEISKFDLELLKYHYSYGICKGTSLRVFEDQHKRAKENHSKIRTTTYFYHTN